MDGTSCASGKICIRGECVSKLGAPVGDCLFGDKYLVQSDVPKISLPASSMTCSAFFDFVIGRNLSAESFCSKKSQIGRNCCLSCQSNKKN